MSNTMNTAALSAYYGKHLNQLIGAVLNGLDIANDVSVMRNVRTSVKLPRFEAGSGLMPNDTDREDTTKAFGTFSDRELAVKTAMKIFKIIPEELRDTFMGEMLDPNAKEIPFAQWAWQQAFDKLGAEINDNCYFSEDNTAAADFDAGTVYNSGDVVKFYGTSGIEGIFKANTTTTAGDSPQSAAAKWDDVSAASLCDGLGTILAALITAGDVDPVATGATTGTNAVANFKETFNAMPVALRKLGVEAFVSWDVWKLYVEDHNTRYGTGNSIIGNDVEQSEKGIFLRESNGKCLIKPRTWMDGSNRILMTPKKNVWMGTNLTTDFRKLGKTVELLHGMKAITKFLIGFQFADEKVIYCNDQA